MFKNHHYADVGCLTLALIAGTCFAQNLETAKFFKLEFVVKEMDGAKVLNARTYSMTTSTENRGGAFIRTGSKVPVPSAPGSAQFNFIELGVNIDVRSVSELRNELFMIVTAEISSTAQESTGPSYPVLRQNKWNSNVLVPLKKATVIFSSDDTTTRHQMQMEVTATPIP